VGALVLDSCRGIVEDDDDEGGRGLDSASSGTSGDAERKGSKAESSLFLMAVNSMLGSVAVVVIGGNGMDCGQADSVEDEESRGEEEPRAESKASEVSLRRETCWRCCCCCCSLER